MYFTLWSPQAAPPLPAPEEAEVDALLLELIGGGRRGEPSDAGRWPGGGRAPARHGGGRGPVCHGGGQGTAHRNVGRALGSCEKLELQPIVAEVCH